MRAVIPEILALLGNASGGKLRPTPEVAATWAALLAGYPDDALRRAAAAVAVQVHYGPPTVGHIVEQLEGKVVRVHVPVTDVWGRAILRDDGSPICQVEERRVWPDGREAPLALPGHREPGPVLERGVREADFAGEAGRLLA